MARVSSTANQDTERREDSYLPVALAEFPEHAQETLHESTGAWYIVHAREHAELGLCSIGTGAHLDDAK